MNTATIKFAHRRLADVLATEIIRDFKLRCQKDARDNDDGIYEYTLSRLKHLSPQYIEIVDCQILDKLYEILPNIELIFSRTPQQLSEN